MVKAFKNEIFQESTAFAVAFVVIFFLYGLLPAFCSGIVCAIIIKLLFGLKRDIVMPQEAHSIPDKSVIKSDCIYIAVAVIIAETIVLAGSVAISHILKTGKDFSDVWLYSGIDAPSYLGIAQNGYVTQGDAQYHIVFFPLYPVIVAMLRGVVRDYFISALVVSSACSVAVGIMMYLVLLCDFDRKTALNGVKFLFILPASFFCFAPMTESLFILLCLLCLYFMKKDKLIPMTICGALCAMSRSQGILMIVPCGIIAIKNIVKFEGTRKEKVKKAVEYAIHIMGISAGTLLYLLINRLVWNDPMKFAYVQREHWSQGLGFFPESIQTIVSEFKNALAGGTGTFFNNYNLRLAYGLWLPELVCITVSCIICFVGAGKVKSEYTAFFLAYFVISVGATWLLSAPRYLMACVSLPVMLCACGRNKIFNYISTSVILMGAIIFYGMYVIGSPIY